MTFQRLVNTTERLEEQKVMLMMGYTRNNGNQELREENSLYGKGAALTVHAGAGGEHAP